MPLFTGNCHNERIVSHPFVKGTPGGMFGKVLVKHRARQFASAACQPYVPPRIQWFVFLSATIPVPYSPESDMALLIH